MGSSAEAVPTQNAEVVSHFFSCGEKCEKPLEKRHLQHQLETEKMTQNPVSGGTHEDFHQEKLECQRFAQREALLNPVLGENLEDGALHHAELEC